MVRGTQGNFFQKSVLLRSAHNKERIFGNVLVRNSSCARITRMYQNACRNSRGSTRRFVVTCSNAEPKLKDYDRVILLVEFPY